VKGIRHDAMTELTQYRWPGNIRELENVIARSIIVSETGYIAPDDLPDSIRPDADVICIAGATGEITSFEQQLREYKVHLASRAIRACNGNKTLAARSLHMSRAYLHRLISGTADALPEGAEEDEPDFAAPGMR